MGLGMTELLPLAQMLIGKSAPYDAARAQTFATREMMENYPDYVSQMNRVETPLARPYAAKVNGKLTYKPAITGNTINQRIRAKYDNNYLSDKLNAQNANIDELKAKNPNILSSLLGGLGLG